MMPAWLLLTLSILLGAIWGSFVAALCHRWPLNESIIKGRSCCDSCGQQIAAYDLLPVVSFLLLKGRCRACGQKIDSGSLLIELAAMMIGAVPFFFLAECHALALAIMGWLLLPLIVLDHRHLWLPDRLILLLAAIGVPIGVMLDPGIDAVSRLLGLVFGYLSLEVVRLGYKKLRGIEGMGAGDPKLFGALGIWLGWQQLPVTLLTACIVGFVMIFISRLTTNDDRTALPLGSYLGIAAFLVAFIL